MVEENFICLSKFVVPKTIVANFEEFFSIIEVREDKSIKYLPNRINKC